MHNNKQNNKLKISNLQHSYNAINVLLDVNLELKSGEIVALVGPSGCGKSTLFHIIAELLNHTSGQVSSSFKFTSCVFQEPRLMPWKNALDNIMLGLKAQKIPYALRYKKALKLALTAGFSKTDLAKYPHELSGGMQSRISLLRSMIVNPDLLLLDEPFTALDIGLKHDLYDLLLRLVKSNGTAVLIITHDLIEATLLSDRILFMQANPGTIINQIHLTTTQNERNEIWAFNKVANILQDQKIKSSLNLNPNPHSNPN